MTYKTDKARDHSYGPFYDNLFDKFDKEAAINILELGVQGGGSLLAWKDYFPNANVYGVDISDGRWDEYKSDRVNYRTADLRTMPVDQSIQYDIIIDDSDHFIGTQIFIVKNYLPLLAVGGYLVIEDVQDPAVDVEEIGKVLPAEYKLEIADMRKEKGRYDDFMIIISHA